MGRIFEVRKHTMFARWDRMAKQFARVSKDINIAVKAGGADPNSNPALRRAIQNSRAFNMPKDKVEAAIKRASGKEAESYQEIVYEGYAPHGVAVLVETATDNPSDGFEHPHPLQQGGRHAGQQQHQQLRLLRRDPAVRIQAHVLQRGHRAQRLEDPHATGGLGGDPVGIQQKPGQDVFHPLQRTGQQLGIDPPVYLRILLFQQAPTQFLQQGVLVGKVAVERRRGQPGAVADQIGRQPLDADLTEHLRRRGQDAFVGFRCPLLAGTGLGRGAGRWS